MATAGQRVNRICFFGGIEGERAVRAKREGEYQRVSTMISYSFTTMFLRPDMVKE